MFNVLAARLDFDGAAVLDLYAGSGALGLEALSRGATSAVFVESDARAAGVIADNIATLGASGATVRRGTVAAQPPPWSSSDHTERAMLIPSVRILFRRLPRVMPRMRAAWS